MVLYGRKGWDGKVVARAASSNWGDWCGLAASIGCAIHCAVMPFAIASLPALGLGWLADDRFHQWLAVACLVFAMFAFRSGWKRHGRLLPAALGLVGLVLISGAAFGLAGDGCQACTPSSIRERTESLAVPSLDDQVVQGAAALRPELSSATPVAGRRPPVYAQLLGWLGLWLTPIGGGLLIGAHLFNHHFSYLGSCCLPRRERSH